jgi:Zn-dependent protease with chaperone function
MNKIKFTYLIRRLERVADERPAAYKFRVFLFALLGYGYIFSILGILLGANIWLIYALLTGTHSILLVQLCLPIMAVNYLIIKALRVSMTPPKGIVLYRQQAAPLFRLLDDIRQQLRGPQIHTVLLTDEFNAAVVQLPRLGILGWHKNYLIIGLPLLQALSVSQFTAVLAHEYGHLSGAHGRFGAWIYRIRQTWYRVVSSLESNESWGSALFNRFFIWYIPFFNAYSFVLARLNEYEADRCAAQIVSAEEAAQALVNVEIKNRFLEERFWPKLFADADKKPEPSYEPYRVLPQTFKMFLKPEEAQKWLNQALQEHTDIADTHPCLTDRLMALEENAQMPAPVETHAASHFLGKHLVSVVKKLNQKWKAQIMPRWQERYQYIQSAKQELKALVEKAKTTSLTLAEKWQRAIWVEEFYNGTKALPFYQAVLKEDAQHAGANYATGRILLEKDSEKGIAFLDRAMEQESRYILSGCEQVYYFLTEHGKERAAQDYLERAHARAELEQLAEQEREMVEQNDPLIPHDLTAQQLKQLVRQLRLQKSIKNAYLVRKQVEYLPEQPLYVLGVELGFSLSLRLSSQDEEFAQKLSNRLKIPGEFFVIVLSNDLGQLHENMSSVYNALIYQK